MTPPAVADPRELIRKADADVYRQQELLEQAARKELDQEGDEGTLKRLTTAARRWVLQFDRDLPDSLPSETQNEIRTHLIGGLATLEAEDFEERLLDHLDSLVIRLEAVRHILRDALDEGFGAGITTNGDAVRRIEEWLPAVDRAQLGKLLGVDPRTIQRWLKEKNALNPRVRAVARLIALLRRSWTPEGVVSWFHRPRHELDGRAPIELLEDPLEHELLLQIARQGRASHGA
jgi:transcriptional regulator with XRE-family HTH domain